MSIDNDKFQFIELKWVQTLVGRCTHSSKICTHFEMVSKFWITHKKESIEIPMLSFFVRKRVDEIPRA